MARASSGVVDVRSKHSVSETLDRLVSLATARGLMIFARIDFGGDAQRAGLSMAPMQTLLFGHPKAGTPLLVASPRVGLDLPLKVLAWQDAEGTVWLSYSAPEYLEGRHGVPHDLMGNIAGIATLVEKACEP